MERKLKNNVKKGAIFLFAALFLFAVPEIHHYRNFTSRSEQVEQAASNLKSLSGKLRTYLQDVSTSKKEKEWYNEWLKADLHKQGFSLYGLSKGKLFFWTDNETVVSESLLDTINPSFKTALINGDYLVEVLEKDSIRWVGFLLLRKNFPYENRYLQNEFNPAIIRNAVSSTENGFPLVLPDGSTGYKVSLQTATSDWAIVSFWLSLFCLMISVYFLLAGRSLIVLLAGLLLTIGLRLLMIIFQVPDDLYALHIFSPQHYASSLLFNSAGDLLINSSLLLLFTLLIYRNAKQQAETGFIKVIFLLVWVASAAGLHYLLQGLVINSRISFDVSNPASIDAFSLLAFAIIGCLLIAFLLLSAVAVRLLTGKNIVSSYGGPALVLLAAYASVTISYNHRKKELENRKLIAQKADVRQDHIAEYLFEESERQMYADAQLAEMINGKTAPQSVSSYVIRKYFSGYLSRFDISVFVFDSLGNARGETSTMAEWNQRLQNARPTYSERLQFISNDAGGGSYVGILPFGNKALLITMDARFLRSQEGFPELFISGRFTESYSPEDYSIARYRNNNLVYEYGSYIYSLTPKEFPKSSNEFESVTINGYDHLIYRLDPETILVVSKPAEGVFSLLTLFSWLFTIMLLVAFIVYLLSFLVRSRSEIQWNLTGRIQSSVIFLVVFSFVLIGAGTTFYINRKYANDQKRSIGDQVNALWFRVSEMNLATDSLTKDESEQLDGLSANTNINFNLFDRFGKLIYSSQPKIYENGIIAPLMHPDAYFEIREKGSTQYIHPENAGKLKYISAYAPVLNREGNTGAYLNLPYFEKQNQLNKEISGFLSALLNIYVLLFAVAVVITVIISSRITKPLLLIQEKMSGVKFGSINEQIEYAGNDEIGRLVKQYNRMLEQLALSAEKLAQSERESAWREMARQVAHEIKNPLTPMKLSIQHLQRTNKEKGQADPEMVARISENLIQQIDTLANIATAFSDFAKLPQAHLVRVNVLELMQQLTALYGEMPGMNLRMENKSADPFVSADKDQLVRIFNNILKNAVQAIPDGKPGIVTVILSDENGFLRVDIEDNGIGIPEDQKEKIFKPNFTTKSGGMGLGLAMVRNMVISMNGNISYTSIYGSGTTFTIRLPKMA